MRIILLSLILVVGVLAGAPTYSLPPNFQMGYQDLTAVISFAWTNTRVTFASAHTEPQVALGISVFGLTPSASGIGFILTIDSLSSTSFDIVSWQTIDGSIFSLKVRWLAWSCQALRIEDSASYPEACYLRTWIYESNSYPVELTDPAYLGSTRTATLQSTTHSQLTYHPEHKPRMIYLFLLSIQITTSVDQYSISFDNKLEYIVSQQQAKFYVIVTLGPENLLVDGSLKFSVIVADVFDAMLVKSMLINYPTSAKCQFGVYTKGWIPTIDVATTRYILGLNGFTMVASNIWNFEFDNNPATNVDFDPTLALNSFGWLEVALMSCPTGEIMDHGQRNCYSTRNGCSDYYQQLDIGYDDVRQIVVHEQKTLVAVRFSYKMVLYQYNHINSKFQPYTPLDLGSIIIKDMAISQDFSRVALCGSFIKIFAWNGVAYSKLYEHPLQTGSIYNFKFISMSADGSKIFVSGKIDGVYTTLVLLYQAGSQTYTQEAQFSYRAQIAAFLPSERIEYFRITDPYYYYSESSTADIADAIETQIYLLAGSGHRVQSAALSGDGTVLCVIKRYIAVDRYVESQSYYEGVAIYQRHEGKGPHRFFQRRQLPFVINTQTAISVNYDGTAFAVQPQTSTHNFVLFYKRASTSSYFGASEHITTEVADSASQQGVGISSDGMLIVAPDADTSLVFYFCTADIGDSYTIPSMLMSTSSACLDSTNAAIVSSSTGGQTSTSSSSASIKTYLLISSLILLTAILVTMAFLIYKISSLAPKLFSSKQQNQIFPDETNMTREELKDNELEQLQAKRNKRRKRGKDTNSKSEEARLYQKTMV